MNKTKIMPVLYSLPVIEKLNLPPRVDVLPKIESGEIEYLDFKAKVFTNGLNRNPYRFQDGDLAAFAASFEGQPFLRDHETDEIEAREGTILSSMYDGSAFVQDIRVTTRRGMLDFIEGRIDRFSIGWFYDDCICSICNSSFFSSTCNHWPGMKYGTLEGEVACELIFVNPKGKEVSAVNVPAVEGTGIMAQLSEYKREFLGVDAIAELKQNALGLDSGQEPMVKIVLENSALVRESLSRERMVQIAKASQLEYGGTVMNVREMLNARAALLVEAEEITKLADSENRDLNETERARFDALLGDEGEIKKITDQISVIQTERARLADAQAVKFEMAAAEKPEADKPEPKTSMKRDEFDALSASEKSAFVRGGGKIQD